MKYLTFNSHVSIKKYLNAGVLYQHANKVYSFESNPTQQKKSESSKMGRIGPRTHHIGGCQ